MMSDFDVYKSCCIAFSYSGKLVYKLDVHIEPGTAAAVESWNASYAGWSEEVKFALSLP